MRKTVKIAISLPEAAFRRIEALRRKTGKTRSQIVRESVAAAGSEIRRGMAVKENLSLYGTSQEGGPIDQTERKTRALAAAGRFRSGLADLAENHDRYLEESLSPAATPKPGPDRK